MRVVVLMGDVLCQRRRMFSLAELLLLIATLVCRGIPANSTQYCIITILLHKSLKKASFHSHTIPSPADTPLYDLQPNPT